MGFKLETHFSQTIILVYLKNFVRKSVNFFLCTERKESEAGWGAVESHKANGQQKH